MTDDVRGITHCLDCGSALSTDGQDGEEPAIRLSRSCTDCGREHSIAHLSYPGNAYVLIGTETEFGENCSDEDCTDSAILVYVDSRDRDAVHSCREHTPAHICATYDDVVTERSE